jgi:hypothetical protein
MAAASFAGNRREALFWSQKTTHAAMAAEIPPAYRTKRDIYVSSMGHLMQTLGSEMSA